MNRTKILMVTLVLVSALAPISSTALAQSSNNSSEPTTPTGPAPANETVVAQLDNLSVVTDYYVEDGTLHIEIYSNGGNEITVTETTSEDGATSVAFTEEWVPRGRYVMTVDLVRTDSWSVLLTTRLSIENERAVKLSQTGGSAVIGGPYDGTDLRDTGLGSALGVSFGVLLTAVKAKLGSSESAERVA